MEKFHHCRTDKSQKQAKNRSTSSSHNASSVIREAKVQSNKICIYKTEILPYLSLDKEGKTLHYHLKSNRTHQYSIFTCHNIIKPWFYWKKLQLFLRNGGDGANRVGKSFLGQVWDLVGRRPGSNPWYTWSPKCCQFISWEPRWKQVLSTVKAKRTTILSMKDLNFSPNQVSNYTKNSIFENPVKSLESLRG